MINELVKIGLTSGEARIYLALLKLKEATVGPLAKESKVAYSKIYEVLDRLIEKGLASYILKDKTKYFQPAPLEQLNILLDKKESELEESRKLADKLIKDLQTKKESEEEQTIIFAGEKGVLSAYELLLKKSKKNEIIKYFYQDDLETSKNALEFYINKSQFHHLLKKYFDSKRTIWKGIFEREGKNPNKKYMEVKRINQKIPANVDTSETCTIITTWKEKPQAIFIQSKEVAKNFREYFDELWNKR